MSNQRRFISNDEDTIEDIKNASIKRLAMTGGATQISKPTYDHARLFILEILRAVLGNAVIRMEYEGKKTLSVKHIKDAFEDIGMTIYD